MVGEGAIIEYGAENWQVYQHRNRKADIRFGGIWKTHENRPIKSGTIKARLMSEANNTIVVNWAQKEVNNDGTWDFTIKDAPAGGPYRIDIDFIVKYENDEVAFLRADSAFHLFVGEVFIIAGQSNSSGSARDSAPDMPEIGVSLFRNCNHWDIASQPIFDDNKAANEATAEHGYLFSPWLSAAKEYKRLTGLPVGLIQTALGGSGLGHWNPKWDGEKAGCLYKNMLEVVKKSGTDPDWVLWYQGCSDTGPGARDVYLDKFKEVVEQWRNDLHNDKLKFMTVQINRFAIDGNDDSDEGWGKIREAQRRAAEEISDLYVIPSTDISMSDGIHNNASGNTKLGMRAGKMCAEVDLGIHVNKAPNAKKAFYRDGKVIIEFDDLESGIFMIDTRKEGNAFTVFDEEGAVPAAAPQPYGKGVCLTLERELKGKAVVHGIWQMNPISYPPVDFDTYFPVLSFYGLPVEREDQAAKATLTAKNRIKEQLK